jgi:hypothetical protein
MLAPHVKLLNLGSSLIFGTVLLIPLNEKSYRESFSCKKPLEAWIFLPMIDEAKDFAGLRNDKELISFSYLAHLSTLLISV